MQMEPGMVKLFGALITRPPPNPNSDDQQQLPPEIHDALRSIGGVHGQPKLFFSRKLYSSDVKKGLTRLTIPGSRIKEPFLTPEEDEFLKQKDGVDGRRLKRLSVTVIDPAGKVRRLRLSRWSYKKPAGGKGVVGGAGWSYALNGGWMQVVKENGLVEGTQIELRWFRLNSDGSLGFLISKKKRADVDNDGGKTQERGKKRRS